MATNKASLPQVSAYAVQALCRDGEWDTWRTVYSFDSSAAAKARLADIEASKPACKYRWVRVVGNVTYV